MKITKSDINVVSVSLAFLILMIFCKKVLPHEITPYVGIDYQLNKMRFKEGYGENLFPKHYKQGNLYGGLKFNNSYALQIGYIATARKSRDAMVFKNDAVLGVSFPEILYPLRFKSYIKIRGYHLYAIKTFFPAENENFRLLGGIGAAFLRAEAERDTISIGAFGLKGNVRKFKKDKAVLSLMIAPEYKFKNNIGVRCSFTFMKTSDMSINALPLSRPILNVYQPRIRPKDSFIYGIGTFYEF